MVFQSYDWTSNPFCVRAACKAPSTTTRTATTSPRTKSCTFSLNNALGTTSLYPREGVVKENLWIVVFSERGGLWINCLTSYASQEKHAVSGRASIFGGVVGDSSDWRQSIIPAFNSALDDSGCIREVRVRRWSSFGRIRRLYLTSLVIYQQF